MSKQLYGSPPICRLILVAYNQMSSICGAVLLGALILGILSCRARIRMEREQTLKR